jgi:hypothetical protein
MFSEGEVIARDGLKYPESPLFVDGLRQVEESRIESRIIS